MLPGSFFRLDENTLEFLPAEIALEGRAINPRFAPHNRDTWR